MRAGACRGLWRDPHPGQARPAEPTYLLLHSRLQEVEKRNQGLQQELAALREELRSRGSGVSRGGGPYPIPCQSRLQWVAVEVTGLGPGR